MHVVKQQDEVVGGGAASETPEPLDYSPWRNFFPTDRNWRDKAIPLSRGLKSSYLSFYFTCGSFNEVPALQ